MAIPCGATRSFESHPWTKPITATAVMMLIEDRKFRPLGMPGSSVDDYLAFARLLLRADTHDNAAEDLAARRFRIDDAARGNGADDPRHADDAQLLIDLIFGKYSAVCAAGLAQLADHAADAAARGLLGSDDRQLGRPHDFGNCQPLGRVGLEDDDAVTKSHIVELRSAERLSVDSLLPASPVEGGSWGAASAGAAVQLACRSVADQLLKASARGYRPTGKML
jgi:hypothetical protein